MVINPTIRDRPTWTFPVLTLLYVCSVRERKSARLPACLACQLCRFRFHSTTQRSWSQSMTDLDSTVECLNGRALARHLSMVAQTCGVDDLFSASLFVSASALCDPSEDCATSQHLMNGIAIICMRARHVTSPRRAAGHRLCPTRRRASFLPCVGKIEHTEGPGLSIMTTKVSILRCRFASVPLIVARLDSSENVNQCGQPGQWRARNKAGDWSLT